MEFYASCPEGFESALADELRSLGARQVRKLKGRVSFAGEAADAMRICLWSRLASRVFVVLARFTCEDADDLYEGTYDIPWERTLRRGSTIAVTARGTNDRLRNTHFTALRVKDAICDRLAERAGARAVVDTEQPDARIAVSLHGERASIHLDLSSEPLFRRHPKAGGTGGVRPLRADYAALALVQAVWRAPSGPAGDEVNDGTAPSNGQAPLPVLLDVCGGPGIVLEAASIAADRAPGLLRDYWGFFSWTACDEAAWNDLLDEADRRAERASRTPARIVSCDFDGQATALARRMLKTAGLSDRVMFVQPDVDAIAAKLRGRTRAVTASGAIIINAADLPFRSMNRALDLIGDLREDGMCATWPLTALTRDNLVARAAAGAVEASTDIKLDNAAARVVTYAGEAGGPDADGLTSNPRTPRATVDVGDGKPVPVLIPESDQFTARLRKVARQRRKWGARTGVTCYRVYDADLPDYAAAIDLYETCAPTRERWAVIAEYAAPKSVDPERAQARFLDILTITPRVLGVEPDRIVARSRARSRGGSQYARGGAHAEGSPRMGGTGAHAATARHEPLLIQEGGLTFEVDFENYLDTGIFLDHRVTRGLVREHAAGCRRFLNLFAYTGTATCYAADGGAAATTTVDLSNTYLDWARRNMERNGFTGPSHRFVRADVLSWIQREACTDHRWDLIFCDPPTFSNSAKMGQRTFDVQRDHVELLGNLVRLLTGDGLAIFSCNLRTFRPDVEALARAGVCIEDISAQTIPEDYARNPKIHRCYLVRHR
ncbi:bifunctional 23S rRNA (guanine(2069)-N(7))-methyltransferase RlmK/23S rRNA (guanine(2445)-N(2))-methyltransferase RlmL [Collinsella tanakaei]|uniref:bifunctional 23S rRNA (guanine(2069)-N(7))-methyltransferase RlmK/23S rRNA (guanine(2445)-N(2))-methyltransferase RlmL n=1 Tax=Collinsella tanakaei TaxID=626935 RepID=UPI0025A4B39F|nr:bifunctional 23S rRNA (guanine(2069)-N(7))-methyltransferase RlmK/23S rRNA (guanine(2445)-N(2))-methyltransferase RlmL [Collinsella tanakaei]MDM8302340.1 bifunctional 23S rRNA (guanine(2069)-N(7))-methyltransferase RlmK/23S rRNA (guanine(2445)-N(2))-methyltransferase RlmL [Collinsella tanakaei]